MKTCAPPSTNNFAPANAVPLVAPVIAATAREAGATDPEQLGEQLALLLDGASARNRVLLSTGSFATAAATAAVLIDNAIPAAE
jgi:hypothetical protein